MITRICNKCGEEKALDDLVKNKSSKYGRAKECKICRIKAVKKATDPVAKAVYDKDRRKKKGEELRAYDRERSKLPHRKAAHNEDTRKRRAKLKNAIPDDYDRDGVLAMYKLAQKFSKLTGVEMHVDHIIPLACGGEHNVGNLQLLASTLNVAKGANPHFQLSWRSYPA
jgi:5-methylcytosine-specific restriction endonuclease McrA